MGYVDDLEGYAAWVDLVEEPDAVAKQDRRDRDGELVDQAGVEELADGVGAATDPDVPAGGGALRLAEGRVDAVVDLAWIEIGYVGSPSCPSSVAGSDLGADP